jgi:hypothetical protein
MYQTAGYKGVSSSWRSELMPKNSLQGVIVPLSGILRCGVLVLLAPTILSQEALAQHKAPAPLAPPAGKPKAYQVHRATEPAVIDGTLNKREWKHAKWTDDFVDIEGVVKPKPRFRTRAKMLWDDHYLYIAAELQEPDIKATITRHDAVIFHDNDFEVFLKPLPEQDGYFEFEMNALNTGWDLYLDKPYRYGGHADNSFELDGLKTAVALHGTLNNSTDTDPGWTLEIAIPWTAFASRQSVPQPHEGTTWRINFSRVEWKPGNPKEDNWVWSPQGVVNMHVPERWGYLVFKK